MIQLAQDTKIIQVSLNLRAILESQSNGSATLIIYKNPSDISMNVELTIRKHSSYFIEHSSYETTKVRMK